MALPHQKFREIVFLALYSNDMGATNEEDVLPVLMQELKVTRKAVRDAQLRARNVQEHQDAIDNLIRKASKAYEFDRIQTIERNVIRLGIYELLYDENIPPKVAISEALRLTKKFGTPASAAFVNAILDNLYKQSLGESPDTDTLSKAAQDLKESETLSAEAAKNSEHTEE